MRFTQENPIYAEIDKLRADNQRLKELLDSTLKQSANLVKDSQALREAITNMLKELGYVRSMNKQKALMFITNCIDPEWHYNDYPAMAHVIWDGLCVMFNMENNTRYENAWLALSQTYGERNDHENLALMDSVLKAADVQ